jgi:preprotein translocase subunit YajC
MFINDAYAAAPAAGQQGDPVQFFLMIGLIIVMFYFMMIRPQMKRSKEQRKMIEALQKGDEVVTSGGMLGKIVKVGEQYVSLEIGANLVVQVQKQTIQTLLPKGTIKNAG